MEKMVRRNMFPPTTKIPVVLRPKNKLQSIQGTASTEKKLRSIRGTASMEVPPPIPSFEKAVVEFIMSEEQFPGEGIWLVHIQSQAFTHKEKPTGQGSQDKLLLMLRGVSDCLR